MRRFLKRRRLAAEVSKKKGISPKSALQLIDDAQGVHGINPERFVSEELFLIPDSLLEKAAKKSDATVNLVAREMGISYLEALSRMTDATQRHGITFVEFAELKPWRYKTESGLSKRLERFSKRQDKYVSQVAYETGWSEGEARARMRALKEKYSSVTFRKYAGYGFFSMTDEEVSDKVKEWNSAAAANRALVMKETGWSRDRVRQHMNRFRMVYDIIPAYYIAYRGWELMDEEIDSYARQKLSERIYAKYNNPADAEVLADKERFNQLYGDYTKRKFWVNDKNAEFDDFLTFADGIDEAFCKPIRSGGGLGTFKIDLTGGEEDLRRIYDDLMSKPRVLVEESVVQHPEVSAFYPDAVNTVRIVTIVHEGQVNIISAGIRFGFNSVTDNFSADGMVADVDIETGEIVTDAVNKKGSVFKEHPYSGKSFKGTIVPQWDEAVELAKNAMNVQDGINYVGWDLAILRDGASLIEGNSMPDLVLVQAPYAPQKIGKRYLFDPYLTD